MASIVGSKPDGYDYRYSPHGATGIEYGGNHYLFAAEGAGSAIGDAKLHVLKSTDNGVTWSDLANVTLGPVPAYCTCQSGSLVYILSVDTFNGGTDDLCSAISGWVFDLAADSLNTISLSGPQVYKFWHGASPSGLQTQKCVGLSLVRLSSGVMRFVFQGAPETIGSNKYARLNTCTFNGTSFGGAVELPGQSGVSIGFTQGGVGVDASDNTHIIFTQNGITGTLYLHVGMASDGSFGTRQTIEFDTFFGHLDPPEEVSNLVNFTQSGDKIGFVGVNNSASADGDIVFYYAAGTLNPTWLSSVISPSGTGGSPVVPNPNIGSGLSTSCNVVNGVMYVFWTVSGHTTNWRIVDRAGKIVSRSTPLSSNFSFWSAETNYIIAPSTNEAWSAAVVNSWSGAVNGLAVFGGFTGETDATASVPVELGLFSAIPISSGGGTTPITETESDTLSLSDAAAYGIYSSTGSSSDTIDNWNDAVIIQVSGISSGGGGGGSTGTSGDRKNPPNYPPTGGMGNCIFEFYEMQKPEEVEVLPVPKKLDQLGPMRFDKIGKIFGFRVRLIVNGATTEMPYAIFGDDSESSPHLNSALFSGTIPVAAGFDKVYEIQLPKSINTDIFRLTLGPTEDSFHRFNVLVKVHISGMQGQAKWLPIR